MGDRWLGAMFALAVAGTGSAQEPGEAQFYWGTIRVVEDGAERIPAAGWIDFCVENTGGKQRAEVVDGRWELPLAWPDVMEVVGVELDGRPAALRPTEKSWQEHGEYHLTADLRNRSVLRVVDAETGSALSDVRVATPNFYDELWAEGASPLDVTQPQDACEPFEPERTLRVSAPDYEPWDVTVDFERGGGYEVALEPRASLVLYAWPDAARPDLVVELEEGAAPRELAWDRPLVLGDLDAGVYDVRLQSGPWKLQKRLRVRAGERVVHTLQRDETPNPLTGSQLRGRTKLAGALEISPHWRLREATVDIARFDEGKRGFKKTDSVALRPGEGRTWHWDAGRRRTGVYRVTVREIPWTFLCDVRGDEPVMRTVPEPKVLALRCVAARTREPLEVDEIRWRPLPPSRLPGPATDAVVRGRDRQGRIRLRAPEGWILVSARNDDYEVRERLVRVTPETRELVIPLEPQPDSPLSEPEYWGTITLVENGEERLPRDGWIHFCIENGMEERVPVVEGRWSLQLPWPDLLHVADVDLEGRPARLLGEVSWGRGRFDLRAQFRPEVWLDVTDVETAVVLGQVSAWDACIDGWDGAARASGPAPLDITRAADPCGAVGVWGLGPSGLIDVSAEGYDAARLKVDFDKGGRFAVALERLGALIVHAAPDAELEVYELEVAGTRSSIVRRRLFRDRPTVLVDMPPDYYVLSISANGRLVAQERATVVAKRDTRVQLSKETLATSLGNPLDSGRPARPQQLSGTLTVPAAYERDRLSLRVERLGTANEPTLVAELDAQRDSTGAWHWDAGPQPEGVYRVNTVDPPWAFLARVEKTAAFYERTLPDPVEVVVRFVSGDSHEEVAPTSLEWCPLPLVPDAGGLPWRAVRSGADGTYRFTAPAGHVQVRAKADGFHVLHRRLHAGAGNPPAVLAFH